MLNKPVKKLGGGFGASGVAGSSLKLNAIEEKKGTKADKKGDKKGGKKGKQEEIEEVEEVFNSISFER